MAVYRPNQLLSRCTVCEGHRNSPFTTLHLHPEKGSPCLTNAVSTAGRREIFVRPERMRAPRLTVIIGAERNSRALSAAPKLSSYLFLLVVAWIAVMTWRIYP